MKAIKKRKISEEALSGSKYFVQSTEYTDNNRPNCKERKGISALHSRKEAIS